MIYHKGAARFAIQTVVVGVLAGLLIATLDGVAFLGLSGGVMGVVSILMVAAAVCMVVWFVHYALIKRWGDITADDALMRAANREIPPGMSYDDWFKANPAAPRTDLPEEK